MHSSHDDHDKFGNQMDRSGDVVSLMEIPGKSRGRGDLPGIEDPHFHKPGLLPTQNSSLRHKAVPEVSPIGC
jgi:hypothetical protein